MADDNHRPFKRIDFGRLYLGSRYGPELGWVDKKWRLQWRLGAKYNYDWTPWTFGEKTRWLGLMTSPQGICLALVFIGIVFQRRQVKVGEGAAI